MDYLKSNLQEIQENIAHAANKSGRRLEDITLIGVSKTIPIEKIKHAFEIGIHHFGENRVQELLTKYGEFDKMRTPVWHMIGHLQTNKVKYIIDKVDLIHSVDSIRLAEEIDKRAKRYDIDMDVLIEINIAKEDSKHGVLPEKAQEFIEQIQHLTNIHVKGLMCMAPYVEISEQNRIYFEKMYKLFIDIQCRKMHNVDMQIISAGTSGDYQVAIECGANIVRVGTELFGNRSNREA